MIRRDSDALRRPWQRYPRISHRFSPSRLVLIGGLHHRSTRFHTSAPSRAMRRRNSYGPSLRTPAAATDTLGNGPPISTLCGVLGMFRQQSPRRLRSRNFAVKESWWVTSADRTLSIAGLSPAYKAVLLVFRRVYCSLHWVRRLHDVPLLRPGPTRPHAPLLHLEAATELHAVGSATACLTGFCQHFHCPLETLERESPKR